MKKGILVALLLFSAIISIEAQTLVAGNVQGLTAGFSLLRTMTAGGTTGAQIINRPAGSVNFAAAASTLVVTNSLAVATSLILLTPQTNDATCKSFAVTRAAGSFTITANAACTAETAVGFLVTN